MNKRQKWCKQREIQKELDKKLANIKEFTDYNRGIRIYEKPKTKK